MHTQRLHQHQMGQMLNHKRIAGLPITQLLRYLLDRPPQGCLLRLLADVDDGQQKIQQHVGMIARNAKAASNEKQPTAAVKRNDASPSLSGKYLASLDRRAIDAAAQALRDQAQVDAERAQATLESSGNQAVTPATVLRFADVARRRMRLDGGG
jgi:hypothetical protein